MKQIISAEYVTLGHPDRLCDTIAANLINRIQRKDGPSSHAAVEVFASDDTVVFGGEVTTTLKINKKLLKDVLAESFNDCGYFPSRRQNFSKPEVYLAKDTKIINKIHSQSPDIALGTTDKKEDAGFNDQGIFFGAYDGTTKTGQGYAKYIAQAFGDFLFNETFTEKTFGSDIKTVVTIEVEKDGITPSEIKHITAAIPHIREVGQDYCLAYVKTKWEEFAKKEVDKDIKIDNIQFTVNGTGRYVSHGYHSDASMTGRKLAVNNMGAGPVSSQCQCGGGSYIKPWHASDLLLPKTGDWIAKAIVDMKLSKYANVALACSIGSHSLDSFEITGDSKFMKSKEKELIEKFFREEFEWTPKNIVINYWDSTFFNSNLMYFAQKSNFVNVTLPWYNTSKLIDDIKRYIEKVGE